MRWKAAENRAISSAEKALESTPIDAWIRASKRTQKRART
jgi:hypothetical protein